MAIRYDKKLNSEINRVIKNFNQKVRRIEKYQDSYNYQIHNKITLKSIKQNAYTRRELRRKLNELKRYSIRGMEKSIQTKGGYILSRYELENLKREKSRVKRNISREITRLENEKPTVYGEKQVFSFAKMGDSRYLNFVNKKEYLNKKIERLNKEDFESFKKSVYSFGRNLEYENSLFRDNYKKMLFELAYYTKYPKEKINELDVNVTNIINLLPSYVTKEELDKLTFSPADDPTLAKIKKEYL